MIVPYAIATAEWAVLIYSAWVAVSASARWALSHTRRWANTRIADMYALFPMTYGCTALAVAALLGGGAAPAIAAGFLTLLVAWYAVLPLAKLALRGSRREAGRRLRRMIGQLARYGWAYFRWDTGLILGAMSRKDDDVPVAGAPAATRPVPVQTPPPAPVQPQRPVPAPRPPAPAPVAPATPSVPQPRDIAAGLADAGITAPHDWLAVADRIRSFEPENAEALLEFIAGEAAGHVAHAEGFKDLADYLASPGGARLDPGFVQACHELADEIADLASSYGQVDQRFHAVYETVLQWLAEGRDLPKDGNFLGSGSGGYQPGTEDDGGIAA